ncbi:DNA and RNA helicase [Paenibacillus tyrfis]|uniref:DNA and RNA helicase n=1 Tax=Paenibacillus tyrfis TaxID=1501230 RepID=UPI000B58FB7F|nr:DNA and RNA helicase [Paenibacillus tyrfis]
MFSNIYPNFHKGRILKREMLESLRDYPRQLADLYFQSYSDGIVAGTDVRVEEEQLVVGCGIVKHGGRLYTLEEEQQVPYSATGKETVLKIRFHAAEEQSDYTVYGAELALDEEAAGGSELELGRFKLKEGAKLRSEYQSFADFATEFNTWNMIHAAYAGVGQRSVHPALMRYFAGQLLSRGSTNPYDIAFAMQCMSQEAVDRELILHYIGTRLGMGYKPYDNGQIHKYLGRILDDIQGGNRRGPEMRPGGPRRMIVE